MRRILLSLSIIFSLLIQVTHAQRPGGGQRPELSPGTGALAGMAVDVMTDEAVAFANVIAYEAGTETMSDGTITNERGRFFLKDLAYGSYDIVISFVGYSDKKIENITINETERVGRVGRVLLDAGNELETVEVTAEKNEITFGLDKKVFSVEKQINATGGTAEDVLRNIPSITFDTDGNLSLRGNSNVRILINGKPSALTGGRGGAVLEAIPASSIKDVEIMTNPNAKYSPEGTGGMINIITKKQNKAGFNTSVALNIGTRNKYDGSINLNWRVGKFNFFSNYSGRYGDYLGERTSNRTQFDSDLTRTTNTDTYSTRTRISHTLKGGLEYFFSPKTTLIGSVTYNPGQRESGGEITRAYLQNGLLTDTSLEDFTSDETSTDLEYDLNFTRRFKEEGQEFSMGARYSTSKENELEIGNENIKNTDGFGSDNFFNERGLESEDSQQIRLQADYTHPFKNKMKLETGYQTEIRIIDNDYEFNAFDGRGLTYDFDNQFGYEEQIHAVYGIWSGEKDKFAYSAGLRAEQVFVDAQFVSQDETEGISTFTNPYFKMYPSASASYKLSESSTIQTSYSRRVNRPRVRSLSPFRQVRDSLSFSEGNPELLPEFVNSFEVNHLTFTPVGTFSIGAYYRKTNDPINRYQDRETIPGKTISTWRNFESEQEYGLEIIGTYRFKKIARLSANSNIYRSVIDASNVREGLGNSGFLMSGRVSVNVTVWKDMDIQIASFFRSSGVSAQGNYAPIYSMDLAIKKTILKGKGALTFRLSDPFDTRDFEIDINQDDLQQYLRFKRESRIAFLGFSYSLRQEKRKRGDYRRGERGGGGDSDF